MNILGLISQLIGIKTLRLTVVFIEKGGCERVKGGGGRGCFFAPPPAASCACQPCLVPLYGKKDKKSVEMG